MNLQLDLTIDSFTFINKIQIRMMETMDLDEMPTMEAALDYYSKTILYERPNEGQKWLLATTEQEHENRENHGSRNSEDGNIRRLRERSYN